MTLNLSPSILYTQNQEVPLFRNEPPPSFDSLIEHTQPRNVHFPPVSSFHLSVSLKHKSIFFLLNGISPQLRFCESQEDVSGTLFFFNLLAFLISEASDGFFESPPHRIPGKFLSAPYPGKNTHSALYRKSCVLHYQSRRHTLFPPEDQ